MLSRKSAALGFGRPRRPRRPRLAGSPLFGRSREARFDYHLKGATRPAERKGNQGTRKAPFGQTRSAEAGLGVPISLVGESQGTNQRRRAQEQRQFSPQVGTSIALALGRGKWNWRGVLKREREPKTPTRRAFWGNDLEGTNKGTLLAQCPKRRGAAGVADFFFSVVGVGEKKGLSSRDSSLDRLANKCLRALQPNFKPTSTAWRSATGSGDAAIQPTSKPVLIAGPIVAAPPDPCPVRGHTMSA